MADGTPVLDKETVSQEANRKDAPTKKMIRKAAKAPQREASSISFPYMDLDAAISVASAILKAGGVALTRDQLAGTMGLSAGSGNFVTKVATARLFGLVANTQGKYELTNLGFSIVDSDERRQRQARMEAFLAVPLYRRTFDEFRGKQLPPRPHGLEQAFMKFGVAQKQKATARLVFDKSAKQAGFFATGIERLIEPIIGGGGGIASPPSGAGGSGRVAGPDSDNVIEPEMFREPPNRLHPFIQGLLDTLPEPETNWTVEGRAKWLQAAAHCFDLIYKGDGSIHITAKAEQSE